MKKKIEFPCNLTEAQLADLIERLKLQRERVDLLKGQVITGPEDVPDEEVL